jgi:uncharacterized protein with HEPN domain
VFSEGTATGLSCFGQQCENIILIEEFTRGMDLDSYREDLKTRNAAERCMERISEAAKKLGEVAEELCPTIPWPSVRALGNFLRHEYDRVDPGRVWVMIEDDLGPLKAASQRAIDRLRQAEEEQ